MPDCRRMQDQIAEFHHAIGSHLHRLPNQVARLRTDLLTEEHRETVEAIATGDRAKIARELADLVYVAYGTAIMYGIDLDAALDEVHCSNMSKIGPEGPLLRADGKVLKGPHFRPPDMTAALSWQPVSTASHGAA